MYLRRQQHRAGLMRCATHTHIFIHAPNVHTHSFWKHTSMPPRGQSVKESVHLNYEKYIFLFVSSHEDSFGFICPSFEISGSEISTSTPTQWKWIQFYMWCSQHCVPRKKVSTMSSVDYQDIVSGVALGIEPQYFLVPIELCLTQHIWKSVKYKKLTLNADRFLAFLLIIYYICFLM